MKQQTQLVTLVDQILTIRRADPRADVSNLEAEIDRAENDLYEISPFAVVVE